MVRTLLVAMLGAAALSASAQCTPNQLYADSVYGVWPDTTENFADGMVGVFYSDTLQILVPSDASLVDPSLPSFVTIDSVAMTGVSGLPPGITVNCNSQTSASCTYLPNQVGCGLLEGTPTEAGTFNLVIEVIGYANLLGSTQEAPLTFPGYSITIAPNTVGVNEVQVHGSGDVRTVPNPFAERTMIIFNLGAPTAATVTVYNLVGKQIWQEAVKGKLGVNRVPFAMDGLENGIYLYHVETLHGTFTGRMVVTR